MRTKTAPFQGRFARTLLEWSLFVALSVASTYPLWPNAWTHIPKGQTPSATVPLLNLWTMWWNVDRIEHGYHGYWDAPIYYPVERIFAATEPQTIVGWLAWPLWRLMPGATVYNLLITLFLTLNGWCGFRLLQRMRLPWLVSLCGGAMILLLPLVHWQLGVFQLISLWGILWTLGALIRFRRRPGPSDAANLALAFAATYSLCCYYGLLLSTLLLTCGCLLFGRQLARRSVWLWGALSIAMAAVLLAPIVSAQVEFAQQNSFTYPQQWIRDLAAVPSDYLRAPGRPLVSLPAPERYPDRFAWPLSPGTLKYGMAVIGLGFGVWTRRRRHVALLLGAMAAVGIVLSLGPHLCWGEVSLHRLLVNYYPGFANIRSLYRFAFFVQLSVALLAAIGLHGVYLALQRRKPQPWWRWTVSAVILALGVLLAAETWPARPALYALPEVNAADQWVAWLREDRTAPVRLAFLPLPENNTASALQPTAEWMYLQTFHGRPMANGYTTFVPEPFRELRKTLVDFPSAEGIGGLRDAGVTHVAIDRIIGSQADSKAMAALGMIRVVNDQQHGMEIWQLPQ